MPVSKLPVQTAKGEAAVRILVLECPSLARLARADSWNPTCKSANYTLESTMRLKSILPAAPQTVLDALDACGIKSAEQFLFNATPEDIFRRAPPGTVSYVDLVQIRERLVSNLAAEGTRGDRWVQQDTGCHIDGWGTHWTTGMAELDELFNIVGGGVVELSGGKGSCKTMLALHCAISRLCHDVNSVIHWIDTTGDFSAERASTLVNALDNKQVLQTKDPMGTSILDRLHVSLAFDVIAAQTVLEVLHASLNSQKTGNSSLQLRMLIIDTVTPLLGPHLSAISAQGHATMVDFMLRLRILANDYGVLVLVINNSVMRRPDDVTTSSIFTRNKFKPALGPSFTHLTNTTLWLARAIDVLDPDADPDSNKEHSEDTYTIEVLRSRCSDSQRWWTFTMKDGLVLPDNSVQS